MCNYTFKYSHGQESSIEQLYHGVLWLLFIPRVLKNINVITIFGPIEKILKEPQYMTRQKHVCGYHALALSSVIYSVTLRKVLKFILPFLHLSTEDNDDSCTHRILIRVKMSTTCMNLEEKLTQSVHKVPALSLYISISYSVQCMLFWTWEGRKATFNQNRFLQILLSYFLYLHGRVQIIQKQQPHQGGNKVSVFDPEQLKSYSILL